MSSVACCIQYYITASIDILIFIVANMIYSRISAYGRTPASAFKTAETHAGTTTSWLPIITSPPIDPRCSKHLYSPDRTYNTLIAFDPRLEDAANMTCLPREAAEWYRQRPLPFGATTGTVTSLGPMICPKGYTTASTRKKDVTSTMVFCCPSNYDFATSADHGDLYGCTSMQTQQVTVHFSGTATSVGTLAAGAPSRAPNIAGIAVNGWIFEPFPAITSPKSTAGHTPDLWAEKHLGMSTAELCGIFLGGFAGLLLFIFALHCCITRKFFRHKAKPDEEGAAHTAGDGAGDTSISSHRVDLNPTRDVELSDLDSRASRVSSDAETVVRHVEYSKSEGSSTGEEERTA
jgi:hypothetical protein